MFEKAWEGFKGTAWRDSINVRAFIQENYAPYHGDDTFLEGATEASTKLWEQLTEMFKEVMDSIRDINFKLKLKQDRKFKGEQ